MRKLIVICFLGSAASLIAQTSLSAGTELWVRLSTLVSSNASKPDQPIEAVTIAPVVQEGVVVLPAGLAVKGRIGETKPAVKSDERALVQMLFTEIGGSKTKAVVVDVDNARESVDEAGRIIGILASETIAARINQGIGKVGQRNSGLASVLDIAKGAVLSGPPSGEIKYDPGVELELKLVEPLTVKTASAGPELRPIRDEQELISVVTSQPFQTMAENPRKPSDITNLMFIGTEEQLRATFEAAGWSTAHQRNTESILETVRAITELRGYKEAPMSTLLLDGRKSDFDFQKQNNTFAKRHHLRIWRRPDSFLDKPVWVSSSTHDIGIEFSQENRTFIHVIDSQIDRERAKVVSDLMFTGKVQSLALVERPQVPQKSRNATGDAIETDGKMAVVVLQ